MPTTRTSVLQGREHVREEKVKAQLAPLPLADLTMRLKGASPAVQGRVSEVKQAVMSEAEERV